MLPPLFTKIVRIRANASRTRSALRPRVDDNHGCDDVGATKEAPSTRSIAAISASAAMSGPWNMKREADGKDCRWAERSHFVPPASSGIWPLGACLDVARKDGGNCLTPLEAVSRWVGCIAGAVA